MKEYDLYDEMPWGKHKGVLVGTVIEEDPRYIRWLLRDSPAFRLSEEALAYLEDQ